MTRSKRFQRGFTLAELLTVIAIIGVLAALLFPSLSRAREEGRRKVCMNNLLNIGKGCILYSQDFDGYYPTVVSTAGTSRPMASLSLLYNQYVGQRSIFRCPSSGDICTQLDPGDTLTNTGPAGLTAEKPRQCSYGYDDTKGPLTDPEVVIAADARRRRGATGKDQDEEQAAEEGGEGGAGDVSLWNSPNHRRAGQSVLFYGGHVRWCTDAYVGCNKDNIYEAADMRSPGVTDTYVHQ